MGNVGWQNWSQCGKVDMQVNPNTTSSLTVNNDYKHTWHVPWGRSTARPIPPGRLTPVLPTTPRQPMGAAWRLGLGTQYAFSPALLDE
jgi:long-subunit fatty acid transport protein